MGLCAFSSGQRATDGRLLRVQGSVKSSNGTSGFLKYAGKDNVEKRVPFHINEVAEKLHLRVGDEVAFSIADSPRTKQPAAKNVIRTQAQTPQSFLLVHATLLSFANQHLRLAFWL